LHKCSEPRLVEVCDEFTRMNARRTTPRGEIRARITATSDYVNHMTWCTEHVRRRIRFSNVSHEQNNKDHLEIEACPPARVPLRKRLTKSIKTVRWTRSSGFCVWVHETLELKFGCNKNHTHLIQVRVSEPSTVG